MADDKSIANVIEYFEKEDYKVLTAMENSEKGLPAEMSRKDWKQVIKLIKKDDYLMNLKIDNVED